MTKNYHTFEAGPLSELGERVFESGPLRRTGKLFLSEPLHSDGAEVSLNRVEAGDGYPFLHAHTDNEEIYFVVSGSGEFQVDGEVIPLREGSAVRVAPAGARSLRAGAAEPLVYLCIQAVSGSLRSRTVADGRLVPGPVEWGAR